MRLWLSYLKARNIKKFDEDFEYEPAQINVFAGKNGTGKTSMLDLMTAAFGPADPNILRTGATDGEAQARIEDLDTGEKWDIRREFLPGQVKPAKVKSSRTGPLGAGPTWLKGIIDLVSMNPIRNAMNASEKEQAQILLETMTLELEPGALKEAVKGCPEFAKEAEEAQAKLPALDAIAHLAQPNKGTIYLARRDANRDVKKARIHAQELRDSLPAEADGTNWTEKAGELSLKLQDAAAQEGRDQMAAEREFANAKQELGSRFSKTAHAIDEEIDAEIRKLEERRRARKSDLDAQERIERDKLSEAHQGALKAITEAIRPVREGLTAQHATAQQNAGRQDADARTKANAEQNEREAAELESKSEAMTTALKNLDGVCEKLLEKLPIKGLAVTGNIPYLDGVPLSQVNTQQRGDFWLKVGVMRAGELGMVCMDGAECFDDEHFERWLNTAKKIPDVQFFFGRVDSKPFRIEKF